MNLLAPLPGLHDLALVVDNIVDVVFTTDASFSMRFVSPSIEHLLGCTPEQARGSAIRDAVHPEDVPRLQALFGEIVSGRATTGQIELRMRHARTGEYVWVESIGKALRDPAGHFAGNVVVLRDVSARKRAEAALVEVT